MTPDLQLRWQSRCAPFDGTTITICDDPTPEEVLRLLRSIAAWLRQRYPTVLQFDDWHEHDGFLTQPSVMDWEAMSACWHDVPSWKMASPDDDHVRKAIYSPTCDWLLRCSLDSNDADSLDNAYPYLDFTAAAGSRALELINAIGERLPGCTSVSPAAMYFQSRYGG